MAALQQDSTPAVHELQRAAGREPRTSRAAAALISVIPSLHADMKRGNAYNDYQCAAQGQTSTVRPSVLAMETISGVITSQPTKWSKPATGLFSRNGRLVITGLFVFISNSSAAPPEPRRHETNIRLGSDRSIIAIRANPRASYSRSVSRTGGNEHPRPPVAGFSPLVAITTSDERRDPSTEEAFEQDLQATYVGSPLTGLTTPDFVIGFLDSGADVDLAAGSFANTLGLVGPYLTQNIATLIGVGDEQVEALLTQPVGIFAAGLSAIRLNGTLDLGAVVGHTNVSAVVAPPIECAGQEVVSAIAGMPFMSFFSSIFRVDTPRTVIHDGRTYTGPDVEILSRFELPSPDLEWQHRMSIVFGGQIPALTASYYPDILDFEDQETPFYPTMMAAFPGIPPTGGKFFATLWVAEGPLSPTNPVQEMRVLVDTGAQSSIMSSDMVANLSLPFEPDFEVDVCGVGGITTGVPGYYVDFVKMPANGGALDFSKAPFIVLDLPNPEGDPPILSGILGMNFFWNRNVWFDPALTASASIWLSGPVDFAYGDFDRDLDVDDGDASAFVRCLSGPEGGVLGPECYHLDSEEDGDLDLADFAAFQLCYSGTDASADPLCNAE